MLITKRKRNSAQTRESLVQAAFWEIYRSGFQTASLDRILADAGVTKGALYHHFSSKTALGYAVVDEVILGWIYQFWIRPLRALEDPIDALLSIPQGLDGELSSLSSEFGCPLNNLAQEMSAVDEGFRQRLNNVYRLWRDNLAEVLRLGQERGQVRAEIDSDTAAAFIIAALEGSIGMVKNAPDRGLLEVCRDGLRDYLEGLRNGPRRG